MASMLANTKSNVHFHIISNRLSDENKAKLSSLSERFRHMRLSFHEFTFDISRFETWNAGYTAEIYYRCYLPEILPDLERILYIDGDTVINGDISELWNIDLGKYTIGGVVDYANQRYIERNKAIDFNDDDLYFCSGVMLINLKKFEKYLFPQQIHTVMPELNKMFKKINSGLYHDQDLLNYRFNADKSVLFLPLQYDFLDHIILYNWPLPFNRGRYELKDWALAYSNPVIIHYTGPKPVTLTLNGEFKPSYYLSLYYKYKALTPFYNPLDEQRIAEYDRRYLLTKDSLIPTNMYIQWFWRDIFFHSAEYVRQIIGSRKLVFWGAGGVEGGGHITHIMAIFASNGLYPDTIVDGLVSNHGKNVFEYTVQPAEVLKGKADEYFVVLCMETKQARDIVIKLLKDLGYDENGFVHAYAEAYERKDKLFLDDKCC
jgi:lipopolysaccharide biosynthesis glycosyltransferase